MRIPSSIVNLTCGVFTPLAVSFLQDSLTTMLPWLIAMFAVVVTDLMFGVRKSLKLDIHVSVSMAIRETMGKLLVYTSFVIMVCMIEVAAQHALKVAMWSCLLICAIEGCSIIGNMLKPYGIELSLKNVIKAFISRSTGVDQETANTIVGDAPVSKMENTTQKEYEEQVPDDVIQRVRESERSRWERRDTHHYGSAKQVKKKEEKK